MIFLLVQMVLRRVVRGHRREAGIDSLSRQLRLLLRHLQMHQSWIFQGHHRNQLQLLLEQVMILNRLRKFTLFHWRKMICLKILRRCRWKIYQRWGHLQQKRFMWKKRWKLWILMLCFLMGSLESLHHKLLISKIFLRWVQLNVTSFSMMGV